MRSLRSTACALGLGALVVPLAPSALSAAPPPVPIGCVLESVRVSVLDEVDDSWVEIGVRLRASGAPTASCTIDFTQLALGTPDAVGPTPTIALAATWVAGKPVPPLLTADGVAAVSLRSWSGEVTSTPIVVSTRLLVEGTGLGLRVELPRTALPGLAHGGARVERRAKSARPATGRFGPLGTIEVPPTPPGSRGRRPDLAAVGRANDRRGGPERRARDPAAVAGGAHVRCAPPDDTAPGPRSRRVRPGRVGRARQARVRGRPARGSAGGRARHAHPRVVRVGASLQAVRVAKTAAPPETVAVPASVVDAIGDVEARLAKRHSAVGRLLPLGRPAVFRKILEGRPWADAPRAKAAKDAVERLAPLGAADLTAFLVPPMLDGASLPIDPPAPADAPLVAVPPAVGDDPVVTPPSPNGPSIQQAPRRKTGKRAGLGLLLVLVGVGIARLLREDD
ncbi:MAG: hypothetical protein IPJ34_23935 [Myxococcales bacterium]|nr:hypothetical protein [Myxococcales bacterium]